MFKSLGPASDCLEPMSARKRPVPDTQFDDDSSSTNSSSSDSEKSSSDVENATATEERIAQDRDVISICILAIWII